jgi:hypothetical protein
MLFVFGGFWVFKGFLKMGSISCAETSVTSYKSIIFGIVEDRISPFEFGKRRLSCAETSLTNYKSVTCNIVEERISPFEFGKRRL